MGVIDQFNAEVAAKRKAGYLEHYLEQHRRDAETLARALGRKTSGDDLSTEEKARLDAFLRDEFDRDDTLQQELEAVIAHQQESFYDCRYKWFARGLPERAFDTALEPDETAAIAAMREFQHDGDEIALLLGPPGTGKTTACCWWAWEYWPGPVPPMFCTGAELARSSKFDSDRDRLLSAPALILDDLGVENSTADIDELVDAYYRERSHLVITSNMTQAAFAEKYGLRVVDRIREAGSVIAIKGASLRSKR